MPTNPRACLHCGSTSMKRGARKFCSQRCKGLHQCSEMTADCAICGKTFTHIVSRAKRAKYCSRACYYKSLTHSGSVVFPCAWCGTQIRKPPSHAFKSNFCSMKCRGLGMSKAVGGTKYAEYVEDWSKCSRCGWHEEVATLVVHHRDRNPKNNDVTNREVLCWNCHMTEHYRSGDGPYTAGKTLRKQCVVT